MHTYTGSHQQLRHVVVGGYTPEMGGRATGITCFTADLSTTPHLEPVGHLDLDSPSYLIPHPQKPWLLAVSETRPSQLSTIHLHDDGRLERISSVGTGGDWACHLALTPDQRHVLVTNYASGSVSSCHLTDQGTLALIDQITFAGSGPHPERQEAPHTHQVVHDPITNEWLVPDLGTDRIHRLTLAEDGRLGVAGPPIVAPAGSGPRHLLVIDDVLVVACELSAQLWICSRAPEGWDHHGVVNSSNCADEGTTTSALRIDGNTIAVANRGVGTLAWFRLGRHGQTGPTLTMLREEPCHGSWPRDVVLTEAHAWVANQTSDQLVLLHRAAVGETETLKFSTPSPACVLLIADTD